MQSKDSHIPVKTMGTRRVTGNKSRRMERHTSRKYSASDNQDAMMNINVTGNNKYGVTFNSIADINPDQMRNSVCKMRTIVMKLLYYDDVTQPDYEPHFLHGTKNPLRMEVGNVVNSKHVNVKGNVTEENATR
ncbi:hypothetical protein DY000_02057876 [Brassica cretica]|uniref:HORMA domain-containing protein n=1 Tax=Brassica cretica TaxID=69181 RepID=A0ABQ7A830_BRACR|nr:hypothetical protein DY000_02057876 [Brassica cretica]